MRSKREIENQIRHFRDECGKQGTAENDIWIKALEWVIGDEQHRETFDNWLRELRSAARIESLTENVVARLVIKELLSRLE